MDDLKPCPFCGSKRLFEDKDFYFPLFGYAIGCLEIDCEQGLVIKYGFSEKAAQKRAIRAWNRRATKLIKLFEGVTE